MKAPIGLFALGVLTTMGRAIAGLNPEGVLCGDIRCSTVQYCSHYDTHCKPCSNICDATARNYQPDECTKDCQEYLHNQRYVLLERYEDLRGEVSRLWILVAISTAAAILSLLSSMYLLGKMFPRWGKMRATVARAFTGKWIKNDRRNRNEPKPQDDAELGASKHNGLKLTMPTISASVAPSREPERGNGNGNGNESGSGSRSSAGHATPNTTTTSLSGRHPSEDTTLDYAYDNPAMSPSPETAQLRTKRESSF
ncbi:uncharacterized protein LOC100881414 [Megachile rotundata]|uniref:uncharacterized protein LOC100881414 n=1 Tax=Megachile rotundata TaxID=143995 RepID=UPI003FD62A9F